MKNRFKGFLRAGTVTVAVCLLLTACGGNAKPSAEQPQAKQSTQKADSGAKETAAPALKPVTLKMMIPGPPQKDQALVNDAVSKYLKDKLNVTLDLEQVEFAGFPNKSNLVIASGETCDILFSAAWTGYLQNSSKGAFVELSGLLEKHAQSVLKSQYAWALDATKVNGKIYGVPTYQMLAQSRGFTLRKDLVDKHGIKVKDVNTFDDIEAMFKVIKEKEPNIIPYYVNNQKPVYQMSMWDFQGGDGAVAVDGSKTDYKYVNFFETEDYKAFIKQARKWFLADYTNKDAATNNQNADSNLKSGKYFSYRGQTNAPQLDSISKAVGQPVVHAIVLPPILQTESVLGAMFSIPLQSKNQERAMMFINQMHTDKQLVNMLTYGIEGVHYVKKSDNAIDIAPGVNPASNPYFNLNWMFGNQALLYIYGDQNPNAAKILDDFNKNAVKTSTYGFTYNPEKMKNEIAAITNVVKEFDPGLSTGAIDPEKDGVYEKFLTKLKAAGVDKLVADKQSQLDEWLKQTGKK